MSDDDLDALIAELDAISEVMDEDDPGPAETIVKGRAFTDEDVARAAVALNNLWLAPHDDFGPTREEEASAALTAAAPAIAERAATATEEAIVAYLRYMEICYSDAKGRRVCGHIAGLIAAGVYQENPDE